MIVITLSHPVSSQTLPLSAAMQRSNPAERVGADSSPGVLGFQHRAAVF